ncbi:MAG: PLP-dependent aminotransferase family protein [Rhodospirillales bacterium]|nr:PLP-dependent aminotransferase family protein [Rhodospirillales bacterium]
MGPIFELPIRLPAKGSRALLRELHRQLRAAIIDGRLKPGSRLPASRALAAALGVSRNTTVAAYDLLLSEGYLESRPGAGTYVATALPQKARRRTRGGSRAAVDPRLAGIWREPPALLQPAPGGPYRFDFRLGHPDIRLFPFQVWRRLSARALRAASRAPAVYGEPEGRPALREAIARYVSFARAVASRPEDVVVTAGAQQAFDLIARILVVPGQTVVAVEDPGYTPLRLAFAAAGAKLAAVPVDGEGLIVDRLPANARVVCVTPSHQFPLGPAMSPRRRAALLDFARAHGVSVVEDDYDSEFRYAGRPLDALQTLDRAECVFYVGTFSKSLFPALRIGFVVPPPWARRALLAAKQLGDWHAPSLVQDTLADFIAEGHLARHIRKIRRIYGERRLSLLAALVRHCGGALEPIEGIAGLHLAARLRSPLRGSEVTMRAASVGIGLESLGRYSVSSRVDALGFGYGLIRAEEIDEAVRRLAPCLA